MVCFLTVFLSVFVLAGAFAGVGGSLSVGSILGVLVYLGSLVPLYVCCTKSGRMFGQCCNEKEQEVLEHPTGSIPKPDVEVVPGAVVAAPETSAPIGEGAAQ